MTIRILAFAALRDRLGFAERELVVEDGASVAEAARAVFGGPPPRGVAFAVNQAYATAETRLQGGDELALLPPVAGGAPDGRIQPDPIDVPALLAAVSTPGAGAVLLFLGTAREVAGEKLVQLEYEAYLPMAERFLEDLAAEVRSRFEVERAAVVHRVGALAVGEISVAIAVSSRHRSAGFDALRYAIERIKERAPIWKKEVTARSERWVEAEKIDG